MRNISHNCFSSLQIAWVFVLVRNRGSNEPNRREYIWKGCLVTIPLRGKYYCFINPGSSSFSLLMKNYTSLKHPRHQNYTTRYISNKKQFSILYKNLYLRSNTGRDKNIFGFLITSDELQGHNWSTFSYKSHLLIGGNTGCFWDWQPILGTQKLVPTFFL